MPAIYVMSGEGSKLVEMTELPYELEDVLQALLQDYPDLLSGDSSPESRHRYLLIGREVGLASEEAGTERWSVDHLFIDEDAVPTIVEVKRSSDTRIRREVVGQMLDYAANAVVYWPVERLRQRFEDRVDDPIAAIAGLAAGEAEIEGFWDRVKTNLHAGKVRLIFVADAVPLELQRIVEFLNSQMRSAEVLALEVKRYSGEGFTALVSRTIGDTAAAAETKSTGRRATRQWDEASFFAELAEHTDPMAVSVARRLLEWGRSKGLRVWWGQGLSEGSFMPMLDVGDEKHWTFAVYTYGSVEVPLLRMDDAEEVRKGLNAIDGINIPPEKITKRPNFPLDVLSANLDRFLTIFDRHLEVVRSSRG